MNQRQLKFLSYLQKQNGRSIKISDDTCNVVSNIGCKDFNDLLEDLLIINEHGDYVSLSIDGFRELLREKLVTWNAEAMTMVKVLKDLGQAKYVTSDHAGWWEAV